MFKIDTGDSGGGSQGPFISYFSAGSAAKEVKPKSWALRQKEDGGDAYYIPVTAFDAGVVFDLDTVKLGYVADDGGPGRAPSKQWAPTPNLRTFPNPEPSRKRPTGGDYWSKILSVRVALSKDLAATWEQSSFAPFEAFSRAMQQVAAHWAQSDNGKLLPVFKQTGVETIPSKKGNSSHVPLLTLVKWVPRPACLMADAPAIDTGAANAPAARPAPAPAASRAPEPALADAEDWG